MQLATSMVLPRPAGSHLATRLPCVLLQGKRKAAGENGAPAVPAPAAQRLLVESYTPPDPGPYPQDAPPQNSVRFTPVQTGAILSGVQPGLTMVVGPPGAHGF